MTHLERLAAAVVLCAGLLSTSRASADIATELSEVLINTQAADAFFIGGQFGPDAASTLVYSDSINLTNMSFTYSTVAGSTYLGLPISIETSGVFNTGTGQYDITELGSLGAQSWSSSGAYAQVTGDPSLVLSIPIPGTGVTINVGGGWKNGVAGTSSFGLLDFVKGGKVVFGGSFVDAIVNGVLVSVIPMSDAAPGFPQFGVGMNGGPIPLGGGQFAVTQQIFPFPESSTLLLLLVGGSILVGSGRWARSRARFDPIGDRTSNSTPCPARESE